MTNLMRFLTSVIPPDDVDRALTEYTSIAASLDDRTAVKTLSASERFMTTARVLAERLEQKDDKWAAVATILSIGIGMGVALAAGMSKEDNASERTSAFPN
jgi:hypothetical protein